MDTAAPLYGRNYPRLQQLKRRYDPDMLFRSWYPIQPAKEPQSADASGARVQVRNFIRRLIGLFKLSFQ